MRAARLLLLTTLLAACAPLDRRTPFRSPAYARAFAQLEAAEVTRGQGSLQAGWAAEVLAVPPGVPLAGYGDRDGAPSEGVLEPCQVHALALQAGEARALVFFADLLLVTPRVAAEVRARLAGELPADAVFFTASHTHSGPGGYAEGVLYELVFGAFDPRAFTAVVEAHVGAGRRALGALAPARLGTAELEVPGLGKNRVEKDGPTDDALLVVHLEKDGEAPALFWSFGCHAVTLPAENRRLSPDFPGAVRRALEAEGFGWVAFAAGGVGSTNPRREGSDAAWLTDPLARAALVAARRARASAAAEVNLVRTRVVVPVPPYRYQIERGWMLWPELPRMVVGLEQVELGALRAGPLTLLFLPGEISGELTRRVRRHPRARGRHLTLLPFDGSYAGYVVARRVHELPPERGEELFTYETQVMSFFGPYGADWLLNLSLRLADRTR